MSLSTVRMRLVSDYSSVAIDYLLLDRPLGFTLDDYEAYTESRGWVFDDRWNICLANICIICRILRISSWILKTEKIIIKNSVPV